MRLAAIDIGTNSLHMIVVEVRPDLSFDIIDREKEMVRLGVGGLDGKRLTPEAVAAALQVMSKFRRIAESHGVDEVIAAATSATREAENGGEFLRAIAHSTGIRPRVISGTQEARLIHAAAVYGAGIHHESAVVIDIGGGSVEITRGSASAIDAAQSFKLGVIRLTERFIKSDPLSPHDEKKLIRYVHAQAGEYLDRLKDAGFDRVLGTSGSILSLGAVAGVALGWRPGEPVRNRRIAAKELHRVRKRLTGLELEERLRVPGLEPRRADIAVAGAVLLDTLLRRLGATELTLCDLSLREGLVLDYIARHRRTIAQAERYPDVQRRSVVELADRCHSASEHATHVARLSLALFDLTRSVHALPDRDRTYLEYAALLHDVGMHISYERHHKHSHYLITNGNLRGFEPHEVELIALVARYHRRSTPSRTHTGFKELGKKHRKVVRTLAAILRLAESLDRSHSQLVSSVELHDRGEDMLLRLRSVGDAELELWAAMRHAAPFEHLLGKPLRIDLSERSDAEPATEPARRPRSTFGSRKDRRPRPDTAAGADGGAAAPTEVPVVRHGMALVRQGHGGHQKRKVARG